MFALPGTPYGAQDEQVRSSEVRRCSFGVATLRRGKLVDFGDERSCLSASGSPAVFQAASLTKPIVATLALKLALRGVLNLDRPLAEFFPDGYVHRQNLFALRAAPVVDVVPPETLRRLTSRMLLSHTSGLPNWAAAGPLRLLFEPGSRWQYSGEGFVLLQHVLRVLTGKRLQDLASEMLFQPLRLRHTALMLTDEIHKSLVQGHSASGSVKQLRFPYEIAAGSLYTTPVDYAQFLSFTLEDEPLLRLITEAPVAVPEVHNGYWGLGWGLEMSSDRSYIWHWGNNPGFRALAMADLQSKDAAVALSATELGMPAAKEHIRKVLPGEHPGLDLYLVQ
jgi:CubicO group peptidase (beta-lactamase class C family)